MFGNSGTEFQHVKNLKHYHEDEEENINMLTTKIGDWCDIPQRRKDPSYTPHREEDELDNIDEEDS